MRGYVAVAVAGATFAIASVLQAQVGSSKNVEARGAFERGYEHYLGSRYRESLPHFYRAYELDSTFSAPLVFAALSHNNLLEFERTDSLVQEIEKHRGRLDEYHLGWLAYLVGRITGDNEAALRAIRRTAKVAPGTKAVYNQAWLAIGLNKANEARQALESLDPSKEPMRGWFPYWNQLTRSYRVLGEHGEQLAAARRAREFYPKSMGALWLEAEALAATGNVREIERLLEEAKSFEPGDGMNLGGVMTNAALILAAHGHEGSATRLFERALEWLDLQPRETKLSESHRGWVAWTLYSAGYWSEARRAYRRLVKDFREDLAYRGRLAVASARDGDSDEAELIATWLEGETGPYVFGSSTYWRGHIAAALGERNDAVRLFREAIAEGYLLTRNFDVDVNLRELQALPAFRDFVTPRQ